MPQDISSLIGSLLQQNGGNVPNTSPDTTPLPQMPGQGRQQIPQPQQDEEKAIPANEAVDEFTPQIKALSSKINGGTKDIEQKKYEEYLKNLGIKAGKENSFFSLLKKSMKEYGVSSDAQQAKIPYKSPNERFQDAAQVEYEKTYPIIKTEVQELRKAKTAKEVNDRMIAIQRQKDAAEAAKVKEQEATKRTLNDFKGKRLMAQIGLDEGGADLKKATADHMRQVTKNIEEVNPNDTPAEKARKAIEKQMDETGSTWEEAVNQYKELSQISNKPKTNIWEELSKNPDAAKTYKDLHPTKPNIFMMPSQTLNKDTNNIDDTFTPVDKNSIKPGEPIVLPEGIKAGKNTDRTKIDRAYSSTNDNVSTALGTVLNAIRDSALGKKDSIKNWTGPIQGNPLSASLRAMGVDTNGADSNGRNAGEALLDTFRGTTAYQHVKAQLGSTRVPLQIIQENEKNIGNKVGTGENLARGLGSIRYSAQIGKNGNNEFTQPNEIGPEHSRRMQEEIEKAINIAKNPSAGPVVLPKDFTSIQKEIRSRNKVLPNSPASRVKAKFGNP